MYTLLRIMQGLAISLVIGTFFLFAVNWWQKTYDSKNANYSKTYNKMLKEWMFLGLGLLLVSEIFLTLKMY